MCDEHNFVFEFDKAYTAQLIEKFEASPQHSLTMNIAPAKKGVYALYHKGKLVYAGKALHTTLKGRLNDHARKITSRQNIHITDMKCRYLLIDSDWYVRAGEHALITSYKPAWNASGFGSHVPGRGRPGIKTSKWDTQYPKKN